MIFEKAKKKYFSDSDFGGGVEFMVKDLFLFQKSTLIEPSTMGKQLANFITCGCESSPPFL
jgi:hypothetical protein